MANKSGYFTDSEGNHLLGATLGENVFLTDGTDLETKLNNMNNVEGTIILSGNPEVRYWKYGKFLIVSLVCGTYAYTSETVIATLPSNLRPIRGNRVYLPNNGVFGVDTNGEIWARNIPQYTIITNIVFLG